MKAHTQTFKDNLIKLGKELNAKVTYTIDGTETILDGESLSSVNPHYEGAILKSVMKQVDITSDVDIPVGTVINVQFGMKYEDEPYEYVNYGNYVVKESKYQEDTRKYYLLCDDKMLYAMKEYEPVEVTYPVTIRDYLSAICTAIGVTFGSASDTFTNYDQTIPAELYDKTYTYRDVLEELAEVTASTICINKDDELEVRYINKKTGSGGVEGLPSDYVALEYIESNGTPYINTQVNNSNSIDYEVEFAFTQFGSAQRIFGSSMNSYGSSFGVNSSGKLLINHMSRSVTFSQLELEQKYNFKKEGQYFYLDENRVYTGASGIISGTNKMGLFCSIKYGPEYYAHAKVYSAKVYDGTTLIRDMVPCKNASDVVGMYDVVNQTFYASNNTGTFIEGDEVVTIDEIDENYIKDTRAEFGEKYGPINSIVLSRSAESDNVYLRDEESVAENGLCEIKIVDNQIMNDNTRDRFLQGILDRLDGLEYYTNDFESIGITYLDLCDYYNVKIFDNVYPCLMLNDEVEIGDGLNEIIYTEMPSQTVTDYTKADKTDRRINQTYLMVDKQNQRIDAVVSTQEDFQDSLSQLSVTVDGIQSKVELNYDFVRETSGNNYISVADIQQGGIVELKITGIAISDGLLKLHITNNDPEYIELPISTILKQGDVVDELSIEAVYNEDTKLYEMHVFIDKKLEYINNQIVTRTSSNNFLLDNDTDILQTESNDDLLLEDYVEGKQDLGIINLPIQEGEHTFSIDGFTGLDYYLKYAVLNNITSEFALKKHIVSEINQSPEQIGISAEKIKLEGYTTINNGFSVDLQGNMTCNNATINGTINSNNGTIAGWNMTTEGLTNGAVKIMNNGGTTIYTIADIIILRGHINGTTGFEIPSILQSRYDLNGDGVLDLKDLVLLQNILKINIE